MPPRDDSIDDLGPWLLDPSLAIAWQADLPEGAGRWSWFRGAIFLAVTRGAQALGVRVAAEVTALSAVFSAWNATLDRERGFQQLDPVDFARYACGMLLRDLSGSAALAGPSDASLRPEPAPPAELRHDPDMALRMRVCLTMLDGWHRALGAQPLALHQPHASARKVASYFENLREDASQAPAFIDAMTGAEPNWRLASLVAERPAMRRATAALAAPR